MSNCDICERYIEGAHDEVEDEVSHVEVESAGEVVPVEILGVVEEGVRETKDHCAGDHGFEGDGSGQVSALLEVTGEFVFQGEEDEGRQAPDHEIEVDVAFDIGEEGAREDTEEGAVYVWLGDGY